MKSLQSVCLDAWAILAWLQDETGASFVESLFQRSVDEPKFRCYCSTVNLGEVFYRVARLRDGSEAERFWEAVRRRTIPLTLHEATRARVRGAARYKGRFPIAYADAFAIQAAQELAVPLATGDPEIRSIHKEVGLRLLWVPDQT